eukprot:Opistho-1_new@50444
MRKRSEVDHVAGEAVEALLQRLRQRRVRVHVAGQLQRRQIPLLSQRQLGQELRHVRADHVGADELEVLGVGDQLDEADRLAEAMRLAVRHEREGGDLDLAPLVLGLLLGETERRDLRRAERRTRHHAVVAQRLGLRAADRLGSDDALSLGHVGELQLGGHVADGVDALDIGAHVVVDVDGAALGQLHSGVLEAEALDVRGESDRHEHLAGFDRALLPVLAGVGDGDGGAVVDDRLDLGRREDVDAVVLVLLRDLLRHIGVLVGQRTVEELDDRDLDAVVRQDVGELHADGAGADDDDRLGQLTGHDLLFVRHDVLAERDTRQQTDLGAGGDDDVVEGDLFDLAVGLGDRDRLGTGEGAATVVLGHLVLLHQEVDALDTALCDLTAAVEGLAEVDRELAGDTEELRLVVQGVCELRVLQERLGGDAADVEADTAPCTLR